jgi:hypothetical protein
MQNSIQHTRRTVSGQRVGTVLIFGHYFAAPLAIGSHACWLQATIFSQQAAGNPEDYTVVVGPSGV